MRKSNRSLLTFAATITTLVAALVSSSACMWYGYQPEEPKSMREN